jgi:hypothetical protein
VIYSLTRFQDCLSQVHTLKVLRLYTDPGCWIALMISTASVEVRKLALQHVLKTVADKIFQAPVPTCPKLLAVILDIRGESDSSASGKPYMPFAFVRSKESDPTGRSMYVGTPVKATMVKHYEPCFDLLDP